MARPELTGCPYFPLDCAYFEDRKLKLLRGEFGGKAETVVVRLWCMIYSDQGYYVKVDDDDIVLLADSLGRGFEANYIREVLQGACRRGLFDQAVFANFHVLTSKGAQRRYCEIKRKKKAISVIQEYWLLNPADFGAGDEELLLKLRFFSVSGEKNTVIAEETAVNSEETPQRKEKEIKPEKSKRKQAAAPAALDGIFHQFASADTQLLARLQDFASARREMRKPLTETAAERLCAKLQRLAEEAGVQDCSRYMQQVLDESIANGWQGVFALKEFEDHVPAHRGGAGDRPREIQADADITQFL